MRHDTLVSYVPSLQQDGKIFLSGTATGYIFLYSIFATLTLSDIYRIGGRMAVCTHFRYTLFAGVLHYAYSLLFLRERQ